VSRCSAPACRCDAPCDAYYRKHYADEDAEKDCGGGRGGCPGCTDCREATARRFIRVSRRDRLDARGRLIRAGEHYGVVERAEYQRGGPILRRSRQVWALSAAGRSQWEAAGSPRRPVSWLFYGILD